MIDIILLVFAIAILQAGGAYVRYMPFAGIMDDKTKRRLFRVNCLIQLINMSWMALLVDQLGLNVFTYKCCLALGWIPFFLSMLFIFPTAKAAQIFILGMQGIYMFALHGISGICILLGFSDIPTENLLIEHLFIYDLFFALTLPGAYCVFSPMLPSKRFMNEKSYSYYIAIIPMLLVTAAMPTSLLGKLWSPDKLFVWLILVIFFIAFDRYLIREKKDFENITNIQSANHLMEKSISFLQSYAQLLQDNGKEMSIFRHDLRHRILALHGLLQRGQTEDALALLESSHEDLERTATHPYCLNPIINAIISIYFEKAKELSVRTSHKISFPQRLPSIESPLAYVLANLLENAIQASATMPKEKRTVDLTLLMKGNQIALSIVNQYDAPIRFDENGYPKTDKEGHGFGMVSIARFLDTHHAYKNFTQEDGKVRFEAYFTVEDE